jgi:hypothetical protein
MNSGGVLTLIFLSWLLRTQEMRLLQQYFSKTKAEDCDCQVDSDCTTSKIVRAGRIIKEQIEKAFDPNWNVSGNQILLPSRILKSKELGAFQGIH